MPVKVKVSWPLASRLEAPPLLVRAADMSAPGPVSVTLDGTVPVYAGLGDPPTVKVGTLPVDPGATRVGTSVEETAPLVSTLTWPAVVLAAIWPKLNFVVTSFTTLVIEIGDTTVASALVDTDAVGPAAKAGAEDRRPSTAAETRSLFIDLYLY
jgi:hypothetical protein